MPKYDKPDLTKLRQQEKKLPTNPWIASLALALLLQAPAPSAYASGCSTETRLAGNLYGAIELALDWSDEEIECDSMGRPGGAGIRLRFSGPVGDSGNRLTVIIAIPELNAAESRQELATNLTMIEDRAGRFFSSKGLDSCWADVRQQLLPQTEAAPAYRVSGTVYCINPLAQVNGNSSIRLDELVFSAAANWRPDE